MSVPRRPSLGMMADAGLNLLVASAAIRIVSFDRIVRRIRTPRAAPSCTAEEALAIRRALDAWDRRLPWRTMCFEQGLAAQWMLRRRGLAAILHYGATKSGPDLKAHVWVTSGDTEVVGCENKDDYALLARFPND